METTARTVSLSVLALEEGIFVISPVNGRGTQAEGLPTSNKGLSRICKAEFRDHTALSRP